VTDDVNRLVIGVRVEATGARGESINFPDPGPSVFERQYPLRLLSLPAFTAEIERVLQNEFHAVLHYQTTPSAFSVITNFVDRDPDLLGTGKLGVRALRSSFSVTVARKLDAAREFECSIRVAVQYQRRAESRWRSESDERVLESELLRLNHALNLDSLAFHGGSSK
jgi:hypothetical protein